MSDPAPTQPAVTLDHWFLDPQVTFLNHGSFGACPKPVLSFQRDLRDQMECQPVQFLGRELEGMLDAARADLGSFLGADAEDLVPVPNATTGVNTVLRSLSFKANDELLVTDHEYAACRNALDFVADRSGARVVVVKIPFPLNDSEQVTRNILKAVTPRTRLALLDHVTSQTALILPIAELVTTLKERGVETLVDGAHAPGMVPLNLNDIGAAYYTGNGHKWLCSPKGSAFLHVRRDCQSAVRPLSISHGATSGRTDRSRFLIEFAWTGSMDPTAFLTMPEAIRHMGSLLPGGWIELRERNHALTLAARSILIQTLGIPRPCPDAMLGSMASLPISNGASHAPPASPLYSDPDQARLLDRHGIELPILPWPEPPHRLMRISCQAYNHLGQYQALADALGSLIKKAL